MATQAALQLESPLFEGMSPADRLEVLSAATVHKLMARTIVTHQNSTADCMYLLLEGCGRHFLVQPNGRMSILMWLPRGSLFGAAAVLSHPRNYIVSTETVIPSTIAAWKRDVIRELMQRHPLLFENTLLIASDYVAHFLRGFTNQSAKQRLAREIATLAVSIGEQTKDGILLDITNEDLASGANVTMFTASRILGRWKRAHVLSKTRGRLILRSLEHMQHEAADPRYISLRSHLPDNN
ncbi:cyclic nucleotide-binding protein [Candidatus Koribacter versatilis Ellin345]|uniref:Cyclic nucleotide-binding protein n=1 Tax=Koribacter versatilis (strain Ellin345) TaxID=204669 RepID=Q1IRS6_KORVE|nr:Crp/Fnr family transcriptional regulator [Candidatus Koribacter versatilis]ABF40424.1 cyclic nucleotide-binding protein [Candidatus Koribacter versatilis Ellin345]